MGFITYQALHYWHCVAAESNALISIALISKLMEDGSQSLRDLET